MLKIHYKSKTSIIGPRSIKGKHNIMPLKNFILIVVYKPRYCHCLISLQDYIMMLKHWKVRSSYWLPNITDFYDSYRVFAVDRVVRATTISFMGYLHYVQHFPVRLISMTSWKNTITSLCLQWSYYSLALCYRCDGTINMFQQLYLNVYTLFYVFEKPVHYWCPVLSGMCWFIAWALCASLQRKVYQTHWKQNAVHLFVLKVKVLLMVRQNRQYAFKYINVELNNLTTRCYIIVISIQQYS